jgi:hypothetical protein
MSQALSPSFARCYGLARVARVWKIARASVYRSLKEKPILPFKLGLGEGAVVPLSLRVGEGQGRSLQVNRFPLCLKGSATGLNSTLTFNLVA